MYDRILVPFDRSDYSWGAVGFARKLADHWGAQLEVLHVIRDGQLAAPSFAEIKHLAKETGWLYDFRASVEMETPGGVGETIARRAAEQPSTLVVMTTHGRGRSAAFVGSVAEEVLHQVGYPVLLVGPSADLAKMTLDGPIVACVDGSERSEMLLPVVAEFAANFKVDPWVVVVAPSEDDRAFDTLAANYTTRVAHHLEETHNVRTQFEVLHDPHPARAANKFATDLGATMLAAVTHGRSGLKRLLEGSVTMDLVHEASVPVLVHLAE